MNRKKMLIEATELLEKISDKNIRIFDATITDDMYLEGHIPGADYFDHEEFSDPNGKYEYTILPPSKLAEQIGKAGISADSEVVLYACGMLPYAARAWWVLRYAGHNNVRVLNGGLDAWKRAGGKIERGRRHYQPVKFNGIPRKNMFVNKDEVLEARGKNGISIVNVLPLESFNASHITGSTCSSAMELMQGMDYFLSDDELSKYLQGYDQYSRIITYCGGGVAAAINGMAHLMVGQENVAVYDGSMAEWIGEGLPITGSGKWEIWNND